MATLKDIANLAGVSISTVSDVMNGKSKQRRISIELTEKVKSIAKKLNYVPHVHARALALKKTFLVGAITPSLHTSFWGDILAGFLETIENDNYRVLLSYTKGELKSSESALKELLNRKVDGIALFGAPFPDISALKIPVVNSQSNLRASCSVYVNQELGVMKALDYLVRMGHKNILLIEDMIGRLAIAEKYLNSLKINYKKTSRKKLLFDVKPPFTVGFCMTDLIALESMSILQNNGIKIPFDFSLMGFDNIDVSEILHPGLTTIHQPKIKYGEEMAKRLIELIANNKMKDQVLEPTLIERESVKNIL